MKSKQGNVLASGGGKVFMMLIEGDSATVQRAVEAAERTLSRSNGYAPRANLATPRPPMVALAAGMPDVDEAEAVQGDSERADAAGQDESPHESTAPKSARKRTFKVPEIVDELRAHEAPDSFKDFVANRTVDTETDRGIVAAVWMKEKRGLLEFETRHMHTCFAMVAGWALPEDPASLLRSMKKRRFVRSVVGKKGVYELTTSGLNRYQELP